MKSSVAVFLLAFPLVAGAQQPATILPGDPAINGSVLVAGAMSTTWQAVRAGTSLPEIKVDYELARVTHRGQASWLLVQVARSPRGQTTDSLWVAEKTLKPITHRGVHPGATMVLEYHGKTVHGELKTATGESKPIHAEEPQDMFDSGALALIVAALPLAEGYRVRVPVFIYEQGGTVWQDVDVTSADAGTWKVTMKSKQTTASYLVDKASREIMGGEFESGDMKIRMTRN